MQKVLFFGLWVILTILGAIASSAFLPKSVNFLWVAIAIPVGAIIVSWAIAVLVGVNKQIKKDGDTTQEKTHKRRGKRATSQIEQEMKDILRKNVRG